MTLCLDARIADQILGRVEILTGKTNEGPKVGLKRTAEETKDLAAELIHKEDEVKADEVVAAEKSAGKTDHTESVLAAPIGVVEALRKQSMDRRIRPPPEAQRKPVPELVSQKESVDVPVPGNSPVEEVLPQLLSEPAPDQQAIPQQSRERATACTPEAVPAKEATPESLSDEELDSSPVNEEQSVFGAANIEENYLPLYAHAKLRTSQLEKMMTKEELEEEHRVQREQLAAIFQLLKDNRDTFGDVTEGDVEEQLKLYSI
ncbi:hypothetical protein JZ751_026687 [Albula glossodonta]|uniref:Matrix-remodeling-associated protein 7 helical domain-containing protein n=1 Tax=Albula glossodonta TaxID=121402 RepID=A0A8T2PAC5_9TELE|nr:hypothetical protein JZ751_026687 [Albula glossodonta]